MASLAWISLVGSAGTHGHRDLPRCRRDEDRLFLLLAFRSNTESLTRDGQTGRMRGGGRHRERLDPGSPRAESSSVAMVPFFQKWKAGDSLLAPPVRVLSGLRKSGQAFVTGPGGCQLASQHSHERRTLERCR